MIPITQLRAEFTEALVATYANRLRPTAFLRSFFPSVTAPTKYVSIEVQRLGERIAADVLRGTEGNRNTFSRNTSKTFEPPFFREYFDITELDLYDLVLGNQMGANPNPALFAQLVTTVADKLGVLTDKIERAYELQCSQVLVDGIVTINNGTNIDFKRKAASKVDLASAGGYWSTTSTDVFAQLAAGCEFIRTVGRTGDSIYNLIMGENAYAALLKNTVFLGRQDLVNMNLDAVTAPQRNALGAAYHGSISAGAYTIRLWTYPQVYDSNATPSVTTKYVPENKIILVPSATNFILAHAAVPQLVGEPGQMPRQGEYVFGDYVDQRKATHEFDVMSAGVPIPVAVDTIWTGQALA
jgi:hypothetical protein